MTTILNPNILQIIYKYLDYEIELIINPENTQILSVIYNCKLCNRLIGYPTDLIQNSCKICFYDNIFKCLCEEIIHMIRKNGYMSNYVIFHKNSIIVNEFYKKIRYTYGELLPKYIELKEEFYTCKISENVEKMQSVIKKLKRIRNILLITITI